LRHTLSLSVCPHAPFSQIYAGAPNIDDYAPGAHSIINIKAFPTPTDMAAYVAAFLDDATRYNEMFRWKEHKLPPAFVQHFNNCVHYAECRICEVAHRQRQKVQQQQQQQLEQQQHQQDASHSPSVGI
jgi:hypothetical protein